MSPYLSNCSFNKITFIVFMIVGLAGCSHTNNDIIETYERDCLQNSLPTPPGS